MKSIDIDTWQRREHFTFFQASMNPCLCITAHVDVSKIIHFRKEQGEQRHRFTDCIYYAIMKSANTIPEFRMRIVDRRPVEFEIVDTSFTYVPKASQLHSNCVSKYSDDFPVFIDNIQKSRDDADECPTLCPDGGESQALIYMSCLQDVSFTSFNNPWGDPWVDSVPRVVFGKVDQDTKKMPVSIEALHSFIDGMHVTLFLRCFEEIVNDPSVYYAG